MRVLLWADSRVGAEAAATWLRRFVPEETSELCIAAATQSAPLWVARSSSSLGALEDLIVARCRDACEAAHGCLAGWPEPVMRQMDGDPLEQLLRAAEDWRAELVIIGRETDGDTGVGGGIDRMAARYLPCSVALVNRVPEMMRQVVVGMDGSAGAREAVRLLSGLTFDPGCRVLALGVVNAAWRRAIGDAELTPPPMRAALGDMEAWQAAEMRATLLRTTAGLADSASVEIDTPVGIPADALLRAVGERAADLVAIGHQGTERVRRLPLGPVAERVIAGATCPILIGRR